MQASDCPFLACLEAPNRHNATMRNVAPMMWRRVRDWPRRLPLADVASLRIHYPPEFAVHFKPITDHRVAIQSAEDCRLSVVPQHNGPRAVSDVLLDALGHEGAIAA